MDDFDPASPPESDDSVRDRWRSGADTFDRVYEVVLGISSPTPYTEIAELADCSSNAAKKHLDRLVEMGIARTESGSRPARYARHDGYLEWQEASRIARDLSVDEIVDRVRSLEDERARYERRFEATDPSTVSAFDGADHDAVHERMRELAEWEGIVRDVRLYELARQLARNDGHLIPA